MQAETGMGKGVMCGWRGEALGGGRNDSGPEVEYAIGRIINTWVVAVT